MTQTRILHVFKDFTPRRGGGGVSRHIAGLARISASLGYLPRVIASVADTDEGGDAYSAYQTNLGELTQHVSWAHIVHIHGARNLLTAQAALFARMQGKRLIYTPHCYYDNDQGLLKPLAKWFWDLIVERWLLRSADASVLLTDFWVGYLHQRGLKVKNPVLLPNCVLASDLLCQPRATGGLSGTPSILSVGRLDRIKRLEDVIHSLELPDLAQANLHIVGSGPDRARLEAITKDRGLEERVHFHGFINDTIVAEMAAKANVFVLPSATEGMPTVLIEMLLLGCPVVASDIPGNRAVLGPLGLEDALYPLADIQALAKSIGKQSRSSISATQMTSIHCNFTWEGVQTRILSLYDDVANTMNPPRI